MQKRHKKNPHQDGGGKRDEHTPNALGGWGLGNYAIVNVMVAELPTKSTPTIVTISPA